jgi:phage tail-like protein
MARHDPLRNFRFRLEIAGIQTASFSEVTIGATATDVVEYREGTDPSHVRKLAGLTKFGNITLKHGVTDSLELFNWHKAIAGGQIATNRRSIAIVVQDESGADKARYMVSEAWPVKYDPSDLNGKGNEVFIETLELANEGIERVS